MKKIITFISDTHSKHKHCENDLPGGDILIHAGDFMNSGYHKKEVIEFLNWFSSIKGYDKKIFIAGNHDRILENDPTWSSLTIKDYNNLIYLQDEGYSIYDIDGDSSVKLYGSPWQPEFFNWAFNKDRGEDIKRYWDKIPTDTDVLITHGPPYGICDEAYRVGFNITEHVGCKDLLDAIKRVKPKIWMGGHIHYSYGSGNILHDDGTRTVCYNCSILNEQYVVENKPWIINL